MIMRKIFIALIILFQITYLNAQTIKGFVYSTPENLPVEFANVILLNLPDSSMVKGVITYTAGEYTIENIHPGTYYIKASFVGYKENGKAIKVSERQSEIPVDTIFLSKETKRMDEVVVTGNYVRAKELVDRTVYEILPEIEKTSTNGYDVLRKIPSVQVDFNNNVTLNGKSNFIIQVDGKQRDKEFLARIRPGDIESVEVIHNPSGRYEGDIEGVINVILKKEARVGVNGMFGVQMKPVNKPTMGASASLDYGREKITFYISGYSFIQKLNIASTDYRSITLPSNQTLVDSILDISGSGDFSISASSVNTGFDYYMNTKNSLSFNYSYKPYSNVVNILNNGDISLNDQVVNAQENETDVTTRSSESNLSLYYKKKFKKPIQEFTIESNYYFFNSKDQNDFVQMLFSSGNMSVLDSTFRNELTINNRDYFSTRVDYVQPVGVSMRLEAGYQFYLQHMDYNYETNDQTANNNYQYAELRNAGYVSFFWNLKKFSLQSTLRTENSNININDEIHPRYTTPLPSANLMYKFNPKHSLKFTYNRRINRPGIYRLNPFEKLNNDLSISTGNPNLKPEYKDKLQLSYTMNIKKTNFSPYIYHEFYTNKIDNRTTLRVSSSTGKLTVFSAPENLLTGYEQGFGLNASLFSFNINGSIYRGHFNAFTNSLTHIDARDYYSFRINSYVYAPLFKEKFHAFAFVNYNGINHSAQTTTYNPLFYGMGMQQHIKNHTWGIFYLLPLSKQIRFKKIITDTPVIYSENTQYFDASWFIQVMYSYKFNKGRAIKKAERKTKVESDTKGGGLGQ